MDINYISGWSEPLSRNMNMRIYGWGGTPILVFPCQDSMCDNYENFGMVDLLSDYIDSGRIQLFCVDTVDQESWSDTNGDKGHRSYIQEMYYHHIVDEVVPVIMDINGTGRLPYTTGCSLGATHAAIVFFRRPDLFQGVLALSGCYDAPHFWDDWCDERLYNNSPVHFLKNMSPDHYYINLYNQRDIIICVGQGAWENEGIRTTRILQDIFREKGIQAWVDFWGYDVNHDWPWWKVQTRYFLPYLLHEA